MKFTLVADGSSDQALIPILVWLVRQAGVRADLEPQWADLGRLRLKPISLADRLEVAVDLYPCDLLFVHRDAEREAPANRTAEIEAAMDSAREHGVNVPHVCVVPIRMQEAWLLFDERAIRHASGNPNGKCALPLPPLPETERVPDPKAMLGNLLRTASQLNARRLRRFPVAHACRMVAEHINDYSPLRALTAFATLEQDLRAAVDAHGWS